MIHSLAPWALMAFQGGGAAELLPAPSQLTFLGTSNALAVSTKPHFMWRVDSPRRGARTSAWQVLVASDVGLLEEGRADLWDSGKVAASREPGAPYGGARLEGGDAGFWVVRFWGDRGGVSAWSQPVGFEVAPQGPADWGGARWVSGSGSGPIDGDPYGEDPAPLLRHEFSLDGPVKRARLHVGGLGICRPSLNGAELDSGSLDPTWTAFDKRVLFRTYDVTTALGAGEHCLGLELGNGWFNPLPLRMWGHLNLREHLAVGRPSGIALLSGEYEDGTTFQIVTGKSWRTAPGPTLFNNLYLGEVRDERLHPQGWAEPGFDDSAWTPAKVSERSLDALERLAMPPVRGTDVIAAVSVQEPTAGTFIVDFGENLTGVPEIDLDAEAGTRVTLRFGELLNADGSLNPMTAVCGQIKGTRKRDDGTEHPVGGPGAPTIAWQQDIYTARGGGETYRPRHVFHGFRYMEVTGVTKAPSKDSCRAVLVRTDLESAGSFSCSNELLNRIQEVSRRTFLANVVGVQSDCPHRERFGYGGDIVATSEAFLMNFDMSGFYAKTVRDFADTARPDGRMTDTAPFVGIDYCGVGWAMVHPLLLEQLYQHYGDRALLEEQFPVAFRWLSAEAARRQGGLVVVGLADHEGLQRVGGPALTTPMFVDAARRLARLARLVDNDAEAERCEALAAESAAAWRASFLGGEPGVVGTGTQSEQAMALGFDCVPEAQREAVLAKLVADLATADGPQLQTGIFGTQFLMEELSRAGRTDLALALATRETFPSWGWMLANDATTLWEHWEGSDNTYSNNHPMFGSISAWFLRWLGGIQVADDAVGFDRVWIRPQVPTGLDHVSSAHESVRGSIESNWRRVEDGVRFEITIPADTEATIELPAGDESSVTEGGRPLAEAVGVEALDRSSEVIQLKAGAGRYVFEVRQPR